MSFIVAGDQAWMLTRCVGITSSDDPGLDRETVSCAHRRLPCSTALVQVMTPGLAFYYVRSVSM